MEDWSSARSNVMSSWRVMVQIYSSWRTDDQVVNGVSVRVSDVVVLMCDVPIVQQAVLFDVQDAGWAIFTQLFLLGVTYTYTSQQPVPDEDDVHIPSNNSERVCSCHRGGCGWRLPNGGLTAQVGWLGLGVGGHLALSLHSSHEPGELSECC